MELNIEQLCQNAMWRLGFIMWAQRSLSVQSLSYVWLFETLSTIANQIPLSMGFSRQEYWSVLPFPSPGVLPDPGIKPTSLMPPALSGGFFTTSATWEALHPGKPCTQLDFDGVKKMHTRYQEQLFPPPGGWWPVSFSLPAATWWSCNTSFFKRQILGD